MHFQRPTSLSCAVSHACIGHHRDLDRLQDRIKADMASIVQGTDDIQLPSNMDLAMAVLMMLSGLVFSQRCAHTACHIQALANLQPAIHLGQILVAPLATVHITQDWQACTGLTICRGLSFATIEGLSSRGAITNTFCEAACKC